MIQAWCAEHNKCAVIAATLCHQTSGLGAKKSVDYKAMWRARRGNKYHAETCVYKGIPYHSKKEAAYAAELDLRGRAGDIRSWSRQIRIPLDVNGRHIADYLVDFAVDHKDGSREYIEIKGFETEVWRLKWKLFEALYGDLPKVRLTVQY